MTDPISSSPNHVPQSSTGRAVGIDLGTTNSLVAYVEGRGARVGCLPVDEGSTLLPSAVAYIGGEILVGRAARRLAVENPRNVIISAKRFMGKSADDPEARRLSPYRFATETGPVIRFAVGERQVTPVEVSAEVLRRLKREAEKTLGPVGRAVITVPAYFDDAQRQATKDAGRLAGLEVLRLLNEPTAAAIAYGLDKAKEGTFAVYDLGGGTFDISILKLTEGVFEVKATGGDSALGGDDFDRALALQLLGDRAQDPSTVRHAIDEAKRIKEALTDDLTEDVESDVLSARTVTRAELEAVIRPILERTGAPCRRALKDAGATKLDGVILVGGSTRTPLVRRYVQELFGLEPLHDLNPDEVVALGAAIQANQLAGDEKAHDDILLLDVIPLSLGVETMGGLVEKIIPRNSTIPVAMQQTFTTYVDGQTALDVHVVQGEREFVSDCRSLARFMLRGIPPLPAGLARIAITFQVDADGLLTVGAREELTGIAQTIVVKPSHGLTDEEVERMLLDSFEHGEEDLESRFLVDARVEAQRIINAANKQIENNGDLLTDAERTDIERAIQELIDAAHGDDHRAVKDRIAALDLASSEFARRIMDRGIQRAIGGKSIDEVSGTPQSPRDGQDRIVPKVTFRFEGQERVADVTPGTNLLEAAEKCGAHEGHACGGVCACSTCHVYVLQGFQSLTEAEDREQDILDKATAVKHYSRLGCQAEVGREDVVVEITSESIEAWYDERPKERKERNDRLIAEGKAIPPPARDLRNTRK